MSAMCCTMDFLFEWITPPRFHFWLHHAVRSLVGSYKSELRTTFPIKVRWRFIIWFWMVGMLKNLSLTSAFLILSSFTSAILITKTFFLHFCVGILPAWIGGMCAEPSSHSHRGGGCMGLPWKSDTWIWGPLMYYSNNLTNRLWKQMRQRSCCPHRGRRGYYRRCNFQGTWSALWMWHLTLQISRWRCLVSYRIAYPPSDVSVFHFPV